MRRLFPIVARLVFNGLFVHADTINISGTVMGAESTSTGARNLAATFPECISAICVIDSVVFPSKSLIAYLRALFSRLAGPEYWQALVETASSLFIETDDSVRKAELPQRMSRTRQYVAVTAFRGHVFDYDFAAAAAACKVPVAYLGAARPLADLDKFRTYPRRSEIDRDGRG